MLILLGAIYLVLLFVFGTLTWRKRRFVLFGVGFDLPVLRMIGAVVPPREAARA